MVGVMEGDERERKEAFPERKCLEAMDRSQEVFIGELLSHVLTSPCVAPLARWNSPHSRIRKAKARSRQGALRVGPRSVRGMDIASTGLGGGR